MTPTETLGDRLTSAMKRRGVKNPAVAEAAGVTPGTVSRWRNDAHPPELEALMKAARFLGVSAEWLRGEAHNDRPPAPVEAAGVREGAATGYSVSSADVASGMMRAAHRMSQTLTMIIEEAMSMGASVTTIPARTAADDALDAAARAAGAAMVAESERARSAAPAAHTAPAAPRTPPGQRRASGG